MFSWLISHWATCLIVAALAAAVAGIVFKLIRDRRRGKSPCGCNCGHCALNGQCHKPM